MGKVLIKRIEALCIKPYQAFVMLFLLGVLAYSNSFDIPFYFDDHISILENAAVFDFTDPARIWAFTQARFLTYYSFALNHEFGGDDPFTYHVVNFSIHLVAAFAVFMLLRLMSIQLASTGKSIHPALPLLGSLIFLLHPLNIQAVSYIVQRAAAMAALFYFASMAAYVIWRTSGEKKWLIALLISVSAAFLSKQNSFTLPFSLLLIEVMFFRKLNARQVNFLFISGFVLASLTYFAVHHPLLDPLTRETDGITRADYLATQMLVLWRYIGLFVWPHDLRLEYQVQLQDGFVHWPVFLSVLGHLLVIAFARWAWFRNPLAAFMILFFYLAHSVESGFLPIRDLMFEHRNYLPSLALVTIAALVLLKISEHLKWFGGLIIIALVVLLAVVTYNRNQQWRDPVAFWGNEASLSPGKARIVTAYGVELVRVGRKDEALDQFENALKISEEKNGSVAKFALLNTLSLSYEVGDINRAARLEAMIPDGGLNELEQSKLYLLKANYYYFKAGEMDKAEAFYRLSARHPANFQAMEMLALFLARTGRLNEALMIARKVLSERPDSTIARQIVQGLQ